VKLGSDTPKNFIKKLRRLAILLGCGEIIFITNNSSSLYKFLSPVIKPVDGLPVCFVNLTSEPYAFEKMQFEYGDIDIF